MESESMEKDTRNVIIVLMIVVAAVVGAVFGRTIDLKFDRDDIPDREESERKDFTV